MDIKAQNPIEKQVILVGAGNAHLVFIKKWRMKSSPRVSIVLINESAEMPYSAMIPGFLAREYWLNQVTVDLVRLCRSAGVRLIAGNRVTEIDLNAKQVALSARPTPMPFDFLSLNVGNVAGESAGVASSVFPLRPLSLFLSRLPELDELAKREKTIAVVGAGPSGCEVALGLANRYRDRPVRIEVYESADRAVPEFPKRAADWFQRRFRKNQILFFPNRQLDEKSYKDFGAVIIATSPRPETWFTHSGLDCDGRGFVKVGPTLQSVSHEFVFAAGDVAAVQGVRPFAKNGVYSVRMGETLYHSISAALQSQPFPKFRPQPRYLALMNGGQGDGMFSYGAFTLYGRWARKLKSRIDEAWVSSFLSPAMAEDEVPEPMRCLGCAAKVSGAVLNDSLDKLSLLEREDSTIEEHADCEKVSLKSVDFLSLFLDDPFTFGKIAALHSVSDIYAMNGSPQTALAILTVPWSAERIQKQWILEVMNGAAEIARQEGFAINGGHTGEADRLSFGLSVSGEAFKSKLFLKSQLQPGDILVLTKKLGVGTLLAAWMRSMATAGEMKEGLDEMLKSNSLARMVFDAVGVKAATDVTGFGLAGHLGDMLDKSGVSVRFEFDASFALSSFQRLNGLGIHSTIYPENKRYGSRFCEALPEIFFDPQTSGGLLGAIPSNKWNAFEKLSVDRGLFYSKLGIVEPPKSALN